MYFVARYPSLTGGCTMVWNYFASGYGKGSICTLYTLCTFCTTCTLCIMCTLYNVLFSAVAGEWDGAGAVVKHALRMEQIRNPDRQLQNAAQCVDFLQEGFSTQPPSSYAGTTTRDIHRTSWHIGENEVSRDQPMACHTNPGSKSFHSIMENSATNRTCLLVRPLSCFFVPCIEKDWENCEQEAHVTRWRAVKLQPKVATEEVKTIEDEVFDQVSVVLLVLRRVQYVLLVLY